MSNVKVSKWRQTQSKLQRSDTQLLGVNPTGAIWDGSSFLASSGKWLAVPWKTVGGVAIFKGDAGGKLAANPPMLHGHQGNVIDLAFSQFDDDLLFTGGEDCTVKGWRIPEGGLTAENEKTIQPVFTLQGHGKKVGLLTPHHSAENILATGGCDNTVKIWDIEVGKAGVSFSENIGDQMGSLNFNMDGSLLCTTTKDKKLSVMDSRTGSLVANTDAHAGSKTQKSVWAKKRDLIVTCGFTKQQYREIKVWDIRNLGTAAATLEVDQQTGVMLPFMDDDLGMLYCGGKGDGGIKFYDLWDDPTPITALGGFGSTEAAKGLCNVPKRYLDTKSCEIQRFYKMSTKTIVKISFSMMRKTAEVEFQDDVYPVTFASEPAITAAEFMAGKNSNPKTMDLRALFDQKPLETSAPKQEAASSTPASSTPASSPKKDESTPVSTNGSPAASNGNSTSTTTSKPTEPKKIENLEEPAQPANVAAKIEEPKPVAVAAKTEESKPAAVVQKQEAKPVAATTPAPVAATLLPVGAVTVTGSDAVACQQAIVDYLELQLTAAKKSLEQLKKENRSTPATATAAVKKQKADDSDSEDV